ncbi:MAG TPA: holdfast anchor protein HfaD [Caulobacteraceae bacterium]|nr:holdfast anchor protein HfaD [Caulobacteraceae bacterium]
MLWFATATSQSTVTNNQTQGVDVDASQTLNVVTATSDVTATTTATGNSFLGSVVNGGLDVQSNQSDAGSVQAVTGDSSTGQTGVTIADGGSVATLGLTVDATGNSVDSTISGGGALTGNFVQSDTSPSVDAEAQVNGANAETTDTQEAVQAIANGQDLGSTDSSIDASVTQTNSASVTANGGAVLGNVSDQGSFSAVGAGNSLNSTSAGQSSQTLAASQTNTGQVTQGAMFVNLGNSEVTTTGATATGNNLSASNTQGPLDVSATQNNQSFVNAQALETSFLFGGATVSAYGVGNSMMAANAGPSTTLTNVQLNGTGGVESSASFSSAGNVGFDASVSSTATGNAATGFACSACGGVMSVQNSQTNLGGVSATAQLNLASGARSVRSTATAVGNTGSFYVSTPSN